MKTRTLLFISLMTSFLLPDLHAQSSGPVLDSVFMGSGYANEVYYSMINGSQGAVDRKQWDIAFRASRMSASILTNDGANNTGIGLNGVELYTYQNADTSGWASFDTTGFFSWKLMVNSTDDWETGAFDQNQLGHPDYGWGKYNAVTHDVVGDSLYLIKLRDGSFRKLWIMRKYSSLNQYEFRYAKLDGTDEHTVQLDCTPYASKNFIGYSLLTNQSVDFEPVDSYYWDLLFTRYMYTYPDGTTYPVVGTLINYGVKVNKFEHVAPDYTSYDISSMDSTRAAIGHDWKYFDMQNYVYVVYDSTVYFVLDKVGNISRLVFKQFAGSSTGKIVFEKELLMPSGLNEPGNSYIQMTVYPNPASEVANLIIDPGSSSKVQVRVNDLSGRLLLQKDFMANMNELNTLEIPVSSLPKGAYLLNVLTVQGIRTTKLIVQH